VGILRHKIYDHLRKTCRERAVRHNPTPMNDEESWEESALWLHDVAAETQLPSRRIELAEFRANLELALGKLPRASLRFSNFTKSKSARTAKSASN